MEPDPFHLQRFVDAQEGVYQSALRELRAGAKRSHWMWFIFPQLAGLGSSETARAYALKSADEARAYLRNEILGPRLRECLGAVMAHDDPNAEGIFGGVDALKFRSCLTLFHHAAPQERLFKRALEAVFGGRPDERTLALLARS